MASIAKRKAEELLSTDANQYNFAFSFEDLKPQIRLNKEELPAPSDCLHEPNLNKKATEMIKTIKQNLIISERKTDFYTILFDGEESNNPKYAAYSEAIQESLRSVASCFELINDAILFLLNCWSDFTTPEKWNKMNHETRTNFVTRIQLVNSDRKKWNLSDVQLECCLPEKHRPPQYFVAVRFVAPILIRYYTSKYDVLHGRKFLLLGGNSISSILDETETKFPEFVESIRNTLNILAAQTDLIDYAASLFLMLLLIGNLSFVTASNNTVSMHPECADDVKYFLDLVRKLDFSDKRDAMVDQFVASLCQIGDVYSIKVQIDYLEMQLVEKAIQTLTNAFNATIRSKILKPAIQKTNKQLDLFFVFKNGFQSLRSERFCDVEKQIPITPFSELHRFGHNYMHEAWYNALANAMLDKIKFMKSRIPFFTSSEKTEHIKYPCGWEEIENDFILKLVNEKSATGSSSSTTETDILSSMRNMSCASLKTIQQTKEQQLSAFSNMLWEADDTFVVFHPTVCTYTKYRFFNFKSNQFTDNLNIHVTHSLTSAIANTLSETDSWSKLLQELFKTSLTSLLRQTLKFRNYSTHYISLLAMVNLEQQQKSSPKDTSAVTRKLMRVCYPFIAFPLKVTSSKFLELYTLFRGLVHKSQVAKLLESSNISSSMYWICKDVDWLNPKASNILYEYLYFKCFDAREIIYKITEFLTMKPNAPASVGEYLESKEEAEEAKLAEQQKIADEAKKFYWEAPATPTPEKIDTQNIAFEQSIRQPSAGPTRKQTILQKYKVLDSNVDCGVVEAKWKNIALFLNQSFIPGANLEQSFSLLNNQLTQAILEGYNLHSVQITSTAIHQFVRCINHVKQKIAKQGTKGNQISDVDFQILYMETTGFAVKQGKTASTSTAPEESTVLNALIDEVNMIMAAPNSEEEKIEAVRKLIHETRCKILDYLHQQGKDPKIQELTTQSLLLQWEGMKGLVEKVFNEKEQKILKTMNKEDMIQKYGPIFIAKQNLLEYIDELRPMFENKEDESIIALFDCVKEVERWLDIEVFPTVQSIEEKAQLIHSKVVALKNSSSFSTKLSTNSGSNTPLGSPKKAASLPRRAPPIAPNSKRSSNELDSHSAFENEEKVNSLKEFNDYEEANKKKLLLQEKLSAIKTQKDNLIANNIQMEQQIRKMQQQLSTEHASSSITPQAKEEKGIDQRKNELKACIMLSISKGCNVYAKILTQTLKQWEQVTAQSSQDLIRQSEELLSYCSFFVGLDLPFTISQFSSLTKQTSYVQWERLLTYMSILQQFYITPQNPIDMSLLSVSEFLQLARVFLSHQHRCLLRERTFRLADLDNLLQIIHLIKYIAMHTKDRAQLLPMLSSYGVVLNLMQLFHLISENFGKLENENDIKLFQQIKEAIVSFFEESSQVDTMSRVCIHAWFKKGIMLAYLIAFCNENLTNLYALLRQHRQQHNAETEEGWTKSKAYMNVKSSIHVLQNLASTYSLQPFIFTTARVQHDNHYCLAEIICNGLEELNYISAETFPDFTTHICPLIAKLIDLTHILFKEQDSPTGSADNLLLSHRSVTSKTNSSDQYKVTEVNKQNYLHMFTAYGYLDKLLNFIYGMRSRGYDECSQMIPFFVERYFEILELIGVFDKKTVLYYAKNLLYALLFIVFNNNSDTLVRNDCATALRYLTERQGILDQLFAQEIKNEELSAMEHTTFFTYAIFEDFNSSLRLGYQIICFLTASSNNQNASGVIRQQEQETLVFHCAKRLEVWLCDVRLKMEMLHQKEHPVISSEDLTASAPNSPQRRQATANTVYEKV